MLFSLIIIIKLQVFALLTPGIKHESSALWSCVIFDSLSAIFQKTEALTLEILTSLPRSVPLSFFSCWSGPLLPCRSRIKFAAASSFFLLFFSLSLFRSWKLTKDSKALRASFLPLMIDFTSQLLPRHTPTHTHTHTHKLLHTLSCQQSP